MIMLAAMTASSLVGEIKTHIIPDRHDEYHWHLEGLVELWESTHLGESISVAKDAELVCAELRSNSTTVGNPVVRRGRNLDLGSILDKKLCNLVLLKSCNNPGSKSVVELSRVAL